MHIYVLIIYCINIIIHNIVKQVIIITKFWLESGLESGPESNTLETCRVLAWVQVHKKLIGSGSRANMVPTRPLLLHPHSKEIFFFIGLESYFVCLVVQSSSVLAITSLSLELSITHITLYIKISIIHNTLDNKIDCLMFYSSLSTIFCANFGTVTATLKW